MRPIQASTVGMALYFLARAGTAHAAEAAPALPVQDEEDKSQAAQPKSEADLTAVSVDFGQKAVPTEQKADDDALFASAPVKLDGVDSASAEAPGAGGTNGSAADIEVAFGRADAASADAAAGTDAPAADDAAATSDAAAAATASASDYVMFGGEDPAQAGLDAPDAASAGDAGDLAQINSSPAAEDDAIFSSANTEKIGDDVLAEQRGGFVYEGVDIRFGAEIRSYIGDELVMQTNISWTENSADVQRVVSTSLTAADANSLQASMVNGAGLSLKVGNDTVYLGNSGQTAFIQGNSGLLQNIIINTANNVTLRQEVDAQLDISHFAPFQADALGTSISSALAGLAAGISR